jgi:predicted permease
MLQALALPLATVYAGVAVGYALGRSGLPDRLWALRPSGASAAGQTHPPRSGSSTPSALAPPGGGAGPSALDALNALLFYALIPVLLFRAALRVDPATLPWGTLAGYFVPAVCAQLALVQWIRRRQLQARAAARGEPRARAAPEWAPLWAFTATFGNSVQLGIPMATALFGEAGIALHLQIIALHALTLMTLATVQAEWLRASDARPQPGQPGKPSPPILKVALHSARHALIHPVVVPILAGLGFHAAGGQLAPVVDAALGAVAQVAVPLCLIAIGWTLAEGDAPQALRDALGQVGFKLLALPAWVGLVAAWGFGVHGQPLWVLVMAAALPAGANALLFAQRYRVGQPEAAAAVVASTVCFALTAPLWLVVLGWLAPMGGNR